MMKSNPSGEGFVYLCLNYDLFDSLIGYDFYFTIIVNQTITRIIVQTTDNLMQRFDFTAVGRPNSPLDFLINLILNKPNRPSASPTLTPPTCQLRTDILKVISVWIAFSSIIMIYRMLEMCRTSKLIDVWHYCIGRLLLKKQNNPHQTTPRKSPTKPSPTP
jgi:hypothetical protein